MRIYRHFIALALTGLLLGGALQADRVTYISGSGTKTEVKLDDNVTVTGWTAAKVEYENAEKKKSSVAYKDIIAVDRQGGTMGAELAGALELVGSDPRAAIAGLAAVATSGSALDKEEAAYLRAQLLDSESAGDRSLAAEAVKAYDAYIKSYKAGFFAREAYRGLANLQKPDAARTTLKNMVRADSSLERLGNQLLGELEAGAAKWADAISAFKAAQTAARNEKDLNAEFLAIAWEGLATLRNGNAAGAKTLLESVTEDSRLDDPNTNTDEVALSVAFRALGDAHFEGDNFQKGYDAYIKGAYYAWWTAGSTEGHCLGRAYVCAKKLEGTDAKWKKRRDKLRTALALGFPRVLSEVEKE
ncbi:MAG: hypothetical protein H6841_05000 [Planctomycetes bacterium]|nr:hypothetical protein [Planctomycetota bacterium]MCB9934972.1 hypothetical protein [Planctomycetota bacterium]